MQELSNFWSNGRWMPTYIAKKNVFHAFHFFCGRTLTHPFSRKVNKSTNSLFVVICCIAQFLKQRRWMSACNDKKNFLNSISLIVSGKQVFRERIFICRSKTISGSFSVIFCFGPMHTWRTNYKKALIFFWKTMNE